MRFIKSKLILLVAAMVFVLYLSNDFSLIDIKETAIIIALGLDKDGSEYTVSAQIAVPQTTDQTASSSSAIIEGKGDTIAHAIESIGTHTGWYPKLSFCNVLILGEGMFGRDAMESIDYFIRTAKIQDTVELCAAEKKASDVLGATSPLDDFSAISITKILERDSETASTVSNSNLKDFAMGYYSKSAFSIMPLIKVDDSGGKKSGGEGSGSVFNPSEDEGAMNEGGEIKSAASESGGSEDKGGEEEKVFDATRTLLFSKGRIAGELDAEETLVYNMLTRKINVSYIELNDAEYKGKRSDLFISVRDNSSKRTLEFENGRPILKVRLKIYARVDDTNITVPPKDLASGYIVPDDVLKKLNGYLKEKIEGIFEKAREADCDVFEVKNRLYRTKNRYFEAYKDTLLSSLKLEVETDAVSYK